LGGLCCILVVWHLDGSYGDDVVATSHNKGLDDLDKRVAIVVFVFVFTPMMIYFAWPAVAQAPPAGVSGNCNNFGNNNFNCNTLNIAPSRATFSDELGAQLLAHMPEKKSVSLKTVGSAADQKVGDTTQKFLEDHGFAVQRTTIGTLSPPPDHPFTFFDTPNAYSIVVAPSAH